MAKWCMNCREKWRRDKRQKRTCLDCWKRLASEWRRASALCEFNPLIEKNTNDENNPYDMNNIKDTKLEKPIKWVIKKVKNSDHLKEIPYDILK